jgi:hypothetical protein
MPKKLIKIPFNDIDDIGTLCICALRYCMGRETYMPSLVRSIVRPLLQKLPDKDIAVMLNDCEFQSKYDMYGDKLIDKPGWLSWEQELHTEQSRRQRERMAQAGGET